MANLASDLLDRCLVDIANGEKTIEECLQRYPQLNQDLVELLRIGQWVRAAPPPAPDSVFRAQAQKRMYNLITADAPYQSSYAVTQTTVIPKKGKPALRTGIIPRFAIAFTIILMLLLGSGTGVALAARDALPGDTLYAVKTTVEDIRLYLADDVSDAVLLNTFANERLVELEALAQTDRIEDILAAGQAYQNTVSDLAHALGKLPADEHHAALVALLTAAHERRTEVLTNLLDKVPEQAQKGINNALQAGPPEDKGKPDTVGPPEDKGKPDSVGPPEDKGKPEKLPKVKEDNPNKPDKSSDE
jgi:hypothetical protein